jgi:pyruvate/2-oxoglutarate/acetoin dehydrogenase E1 component/TPP-dependent pyruvate/acetoin dehydrogenase alpha subunit
MIVREKSHSIPEPTASQPFLNHNQQQADQARTASTVSLTAAEMIQDYRLAYRSRQASLIGRREVLSGRAKFGIFGDGKEVAQLAMARAFQKGDFRSGYYRDQTFMLALDLITLDQFFAQLYAHADLQAEPMSGGRQMNAHFATRLLDADGRWLNQTELYNSTADLSPTGSQMPRLVGLAYASRLYRELEELQQFSRFSRNGNEVAFGTIGNASCAEGMFWEAINAIGVLKCPAVISIWDDGYGISVTNEHQMLKENMSELLAGFRRQPDQKVGYDIYTVRGWDYPALLAAYQQAAATARAEHIPAVIHVIEMTQPQGHSTSGSHERYKNQERLAFEEEFDPIRRMREWLLGERVVTAAALDSYEAEDEHHILQCRDKAWAAFNAPIQAERQELSGVIAAVAEGSEQAAKLAQIRDDLAKKRNPIRRDLMVAAHEALLLLRHETAPDKQQLIAWKEAYDKTNRRRFGSHLYSETGESALNVPVVPAVYSDKSPLVSGHEVMNACFDALLARDPRVIAFGEDVGRLGGVNQGFAGLQQKYGALRVADAGIRECTIIGQAIGMALRGLRPLPEIQYLDYVLYALQLMSDDLASLRWRTVGRQKAPVIVRTRGHRLEGIWHSGSQMAGIINLVQGMLVLVPRNMTQAAGFYNTMFQSDDPAIIIETLNGYRLKERLPDNIGEFTVPVGVPEILRAGDDLTIVTYGPLCRIALEAAEALSEVGIEVELIDVQSLIPFDLPGMIVKSLQKTSRILFLDEDMPGGGTAYMLQKVIEEQGGYHWLDSEPATLSAQPHRPPYGSDGNYWAKPNREQIFTRVYAIMHEADPRRYPLYFR